MRKVRCVLTLMSVVLLATLTALGQVSTVGSLAGTVTDPTGAVVAGAAVTVKDDATGRTYETKSGMDGGFYAGNLQPGSYTVTVTLQGFKTAEVRAVKIVVGQQRGLTVALELGEVASTVVIEGGAEVLETTQNTIGTTVTGKAITQLPFSSRDTIDLAILMPGAATVGRPRATSFLGLPKGSINITLDGINAQDNILKSGDGFFTLIRPRTDTIEEFSISTANQGANEAGEGAVQIRMETKRGGNEFHGGAWWFHRNDKFNSNYYFNNQAGIDKQRQRLNQFGVKVGGPIIPDKLFFFTALDFFRNPESRARTRTILTDEAALGMFRYNVSAVPGATPANVTCSSTGGSTGGASCVSNLLGIAGGLGFPNSVDPIVGNLLTAINSSVGAPGVGQLPTTSTFQRVIAFNNGGAGRRNFPDFRFDYNASVNHTVTGIYHYNYFTSTPDFLNGFDATYPVAPFTSNAGSQVSNRNQFVGAWRWNIGTNKSNEIRAGLVSSPVTFFPDMNIGLYAPVSTNLGNLRARPLLNLVTQPLLPWVFQGRNGGIFQLIETFSWSKGKHNLSIGGNWTEILWKDFNDAASVANVSLGINSADPADAIFASSNFPGLSGTALSTAQGNARALYGMLAGRVTLLTGNIRLNLDERQFETGQQLRRSAKQTEIAMFVQDAYRLRPNLTINAGVRWDYQGAPRDDFNMTFRNTGADFDAIAAGISGSIANIFQPGASGGSVPGYELNGGDPWYNRDLNNFAPNLGFAWTPHWDNPVWNAVFGAAGKTVLRGGYSISYTREGLNNWISMAFGNPGFTSSLRSEAVTNFTAGSVSLNSGFIPGLAATPSSFVESFDITPSANQGVNVFNADLGMPYVQSWSFSVQREITPSTVMEVRYVGNHGTGLWRQYNLNEVNIFENGFLQEFLNAQSNLAICRANQAACAAAAGSSSSTFASFANLGLAGQVPLPIMQGAFRSGPGGNFATQFSNSARLAQLDNSQAGSLANTIQGTFGLWTNVVGAGFAENLFVLNPHARGGSFLYTNDSHTTYNGVTVEVRRRLTNGLQYAGNYTFSRSLTNNFADSSLNFAGFSTLRDKGRDKGHSPFDLRHSFKMNLIYEMPFGPGKRWSTSNPILGRVIGGWEIGTITRWQSGRVFNVAGGLGGTVNGADGGVELIGITPQQIQDTLSIRKMADGRVFWFPDALIDPVTNQANFDSIRPCQTPGAFCQRLFLYGPSFFRSDINVVKKTKINERVNIEYRAEFLNAFNTINFFFGGSAAATVAGTTLTSTSFGRVTNAYQDISTTDDPGGRIIQMVLRINF